jgi:pullulanase
MNRQFRSISLANALLRASRPLLANLALLLGLLLLWHGPSIGLAAPLWQPVNLVDTTPGGATTDGTINANEYVAFSSGINSGFGNVIGSNSKLHIDSDTGGTLYFGLEGGGGSLNDAGVIYIDSIAGGLTNTLALQDEGDGLRSAISGQAGGNASELTFASGFEADYAVAFNAGFAGLFQLTTGGNNSLTYVNSANLNPTNNSGAGAWEMNIALSDIGLSPGDSFKYVVTYLNAGNAFRSDEFHGVAAGTVTGGNIGQSSFSLGSGDFNTFQTSSASFTLQKAVTPATVNPGDTITYTLTLFNADAVSATNILLTDTVPAEISNPVVVSNSGTITATGAVQPFVWEVSDLGPERRLVITLTGQVTTTISSETIITNSATFTAAGVVIKDNSAEAGVTVIPVASNLGFVGNMFPAGSASHNVVRGTPVDIYVQVYKDGVTNFAGQGSGITCGLDYGSVAQFGATWPNTTTVSMAYNTDIGNNDEYRAVITPTVGGLIEHTAWCSDNGGASKLVQGDGNARLKVLDKTVMLHLFEWTWTDVANECETFLGPKGFGAVQVSPAMEHAIVLDGGAENDIDYPWWQRYQPVSYRLESRSGTRAEFEDMVQRCRAAGVEIYADAVINHMSNEEGLSTGLGSGGTLFARNSYTNAIPFYDVNDFHDCDGNGIVGNIPGDIIQGSDYGNNAYRVRTCELEALDDLKTEVLTIQNKISAYLGDMMSVGVAGFRIDAAKHMTPTDISAIIEGIRTYSGVITAPYIYNEVIGNPGEAIQASEYLGLGDISEFEYGKQLADKFRTGDLDSFYANNGDTLFAFDWNDFLPSHKALVFTDNHDNQRGHGGGGTPLTHRDGDLYILGNVFMLAWPYGYPAVMSSYYVTPTSVAGNGAEILDPSREGTIGPPADANGNTLRINAPDNLGCGDYNELSYGDWVCEHRLTPIANMVGFRNHTAGANGIEHWWSNGSNQIAFGRHNGLESVGFVALNRDETSSLSRLFQTGLPQGIYCNVTDGEVEDGLCSGSIVVVDAGGNANISVPPLSAVALHGGQVLTGSFATTDLGVTKVVTPVAAVYGQPLTYTIVVTNQGADVSALNVVDTLPGGLVGGQWRCETNSGTCPASSGSGDISYTTSLSSGGVITFVITGTVSYSASEFLVNDVRLTLAVTDTLDPDPTNNQAQAVASASSDGSAPVSVNIAGSFLDELGCATDWEADCDLTAMTYIGNGIWRTELTIPAGTYEYKAVLNKTFGAGSEYPPFGGSGNSLTLGSETAVRFYYDHKTRQVLDSIDNGPIAVVAGNFQSELGCPGDWQPSCVRTLMTDPDGDGVFTLWTDGIPAGDYEFKVALNETFAVSYPGSNVPLSLAGDKQLVKFSWDSNSVNDVLAATGQSGLWLEQEQLAWAVAHTAGNAYQLVAAPNGGLEVAYDNGQLAISGSGATVFTLTHAGTVNSANYPKFPNADGFQKLQVDSGDLPQLATVLQGQVMLAQYNSSGDLLDATGVQIQGVLDDLYATDAVSETLGISYNGAVPTAKLWAPTAKSVTLLKFEDSSTTISSSHVLTRDAATGIWSVTGSADWDRDYYLYEVEVYVPQTGQVEKNRVTDPHAVSLSVNPLVNGQPAHTQRSQFVNLNDPDLKPAGWDTLSKPPLAEPEDITVYEVHVRDFSINDSSVNAADQGTFRAFTYDGKGGRTLSDGMNHLLNLQQAGLTHIHLLPVADSGVMVEDKAQQKSTPELSGFGPAASDQQAEVAKIRNEDGFNWGYETQHFGVPEGAYSTDPDGPQRILEFREMVQRLSENDLRLVMDVVYNHTYRANQDAGSVLDKIVPGYYQRLDPNGVVYRESCCPDTASEFAMMEKHIVDTVVLWAEAYKVDGFRFDLMNFHTVGNIQKVRDALDVVDPDIYVYGEGWDFGSAKTKGFTDYARQLNMTGTGIGTFNDKIRDAVHGGYQGDYSNESHRQGFANGQSYDWNNYEYTNRFQGDLRYSQDRVRIGLAGSLQNFPLVDQNDSNTTGAGLNGTGYTLDPQETVNYVSKHDNETLFDLNIYKLPVTTPMDERVRAQNVALSVVGLSQGIPFFHMASDMLRSKSMDRDSYDSGDWFNKVDFTYSDNNFGAGLPPAWRNDPATKWPVQTPLLNNAALKPTQTDILSGVNHLQEILEIRQSSPLFRLRSEADIVERVRFHNTGSSQQDGLIVMTITDTGSVDLDPIYEGVVVLFNANKTQQNFTIAEMAGQNLALHPTQESSYDPLVQTAAVNSATGVFTVPARTTAVFVMNRASADISLQKMATPSPAVVDWPLTYALVVSNGGPSAATGVVITDTLPLNLSLGALPVGCSGSGPVVCALDVLTANVTATFNLVVTPTATGILTNTAVVTAATTDPQANNAVTHTLSVGNALVTVSPGVSATLQYVNGQGLTTTVVVPGSAVSGELQLLYSDATTLSHTSNLSFAGRAFTLDAYRDGQLLPTYAFTPPLSVTVYYDDSALNGIDETDLYLFYWDGDSWEDVAGTCTPVSAYVRNTLQNSLTVGVCHLTDFALLSNPPAQRMHYFPVIVKNAGG